MVTLGLSEAKRKELEESKLAENLGQKVRGKGEAQRGEAAQRLGNKGQRGPFRGSLQQKPSYGMDRVCTASISISPDSVVVYTLKYYEVQQRERNGMKCSRSLTVTNITGWQNENKKIRID